MKKMLGQIAIVNYVTGGQALPYWAEDEVFRTNRGGARAAGEYEKHRPRPSTRLALSLPYLDGKTHELRIGKRW